MKISLHDPIGNLGSWQREYAEHRTLFALARFAEQIQTVSIEVRSSTRFGRERTECELTVKLDGHGSVTVCRSGSSITRAIGKAVDAIEPRLAFHIDWRYWFNVETFATWQVAIAHRLRSFSRLSPSRA